LRQRTMEGMISRYGANDEKARRQLERELTLIERLELAGYFLIVWDIVRFCREKNILVQGRGSAANSAVCYSLGITAVDPVGMDLLFERFLSEERHEWPDIDLDLPSGDQRERAIQYVYERYGKLGAAMTANVITYRGRSAAREAGKALSFDSETLDKLTSLVNAWEYKDDDDTLVRRALRNFSNFAFACRTFRGIWGSIRAGWWFARGSSIPWCRSNRRRCRGAWWCSGTRKIAPTWASSKWICWGWG